MEATHRYSMGIVGNCSYLAYVHKDSNIAWMCIPRFDSSFIVGGLLDSHKGGAFYIKPAESSYHSVQYYVENTNVLCTEYETESGSYRITDLAPRFRQFDRYFKPLMLIRKIEPLKGLPFIKIRCDPMGEYGLTKPEKVLGSNHIAFMGLGASVRLTTDIPLSYIDSEHAFVLDQTKYLIFTYGQPLEASLVQTAEDFLESTIAY